MHLLLAYLCISGSAAALEFMPYPVARISLEEWQAFYNKARERLGHSRRVYSSHNMEVFVDNFNGHHYAFTMPGHPAHPSWIVRRIVNRDGEIRVQQVGYYVNDEASFVRLFKSYLELNESMKERLQDGYERTE